MDSEFYRMFAPYMAQRTVKTMFHNEPHTALIGLALAIGEVLVIAYFYNRRDDE